ncbi:Phospholipase A2 group XV [Geodia barretti]|uniref:Phospholipase A2 group XV n=1 Tax=Geodia barretti TaxID=519541 RepID=A0AA35TXV5_GEOBA|nr:Phospholipase A2 group XV [Geodia barretti]
MAGALLTVLGALLVSAGYGWASDCNEMSPIVIVPGILGSQLEAKLSKTKHTPHWYCAKNSDWFTMWLNVKELLPGVVDCFSYNVMLHYDSATDTYHDTEGVETRIPGFGNTSGIEYLDPHAEYYGATVYFHPMVQHFVDKGYERGKTIVSAPFDWRYAPSEFNK